MKLKTAVVCLAVLFSAATSQAASTITTAVNLNFTGYTQGTEISLLDGVTFGLGNSLDGSGLLADGPAINKTTVQGKTGNVVYTGLGNSPTGITPTLINDNPSTKYLFVTFDGLASNISFIFNGLNSNPSPGTSVTYFGLNGETLGNMSLIRGNNQNISLTGITDVARLAFSNDQWGTPYNYLFSISSLSASVVSTVPEPSAALMFGLGLTALLAARRRKSI